MNEERRLGPRLKEAAEFLSAQGIFLYIESDEILSRAYCLEDAEEAVPEAFKAEVGENHPLAWTCTTESELDYNAATIYYRDGIVRGAEIKKVDVGRAIQVAAERAGLQSQWIGDPSAAVTVFVED